MHKSLLKRRLCEKENTATIGKTVFPDKGLQIKLILTSFHLALARREPFKQYYITSITITR